MWIQQEIVPFTFKMNCWTLQERLKHFLAPWKYWRSKKPRLFACVASFPDFLIGLWIQDKPGTSGCWGKPEQTQMSFYLTLALFSFVDIAFCFKEQFLRLKQSEDILFLQTFWDPEAEILQRTLFLLISFSYINGSWRISLKKNKKNCSSAYGYN